MGTITSTNTAAPEQVAAIGIALPERIVPNAEISGRLGVDDRWIETRTGIRERRHALPGERLTDLAIRAAT